MLGAACKTCFFSEKTSKPSDKSKLYFVTSFTILQDLVQKVAGSHLGGRIEVNTIVKINADPHTYQPTPHDSKLIASADAVFINGLGFEGWIDRLICGSGFKGPIYTVSKKVDPRILASNVNLIDPHAWHSVKNVILYTQEIVRAFIEIDPEFAKDYQRNGNALIKKLQELDVFVTKLFAKIPSNERQVVTTHDAFWYFGMDYGIKFLSPVGISTEAQASAAVVGELINLIRNNKIKAVFIENLANPRLIEQIAMEANVKVGGILYADSLSLPTEVAGDYFSMIRHNAQTICQSLHS